MHELSISEAIAAVALRHAGDRQVACVQVSLGALRQVVPDSLAFWWPIVARHPQLQGSHLQIESVPGVIDCAQCATRSTLTDFALCCPVCGNGLVSVISGEQFLVASIDLVAASDLVASTDPVASSDPVASTDPATVGLPAVATGT